MPTLQKQIADKFLTSLAQDGTIDSHKIELIRKLLTENKKPKAEDFLKIFTLPIGGDVK